MPKPERMADTDACVRRILAHAGNALRLAAPLGLGKPNGLLNALYRRVAADSGLSLTLFTALSLSRPEPAAGLEGRFLGPFVERHFGTGYEDLEYARAQRHDRLPPNVRVHEFYLQSGALLGSGSAQRDYVSQNYTHVARDLVGRDINAIVQLVAVQDDGAGLRVSLGSNPDVTLDLLDAIEAAGKPRPLLVAVAHPDMPFTVGGAEVPAAMFDLLLQPSGPPPRLFALPREPVDLAGYAIGLHASALVRDGGTLQIGIGALSDALVQALLLRQDDNARYATMLAALDAGGTTRALAMSTGGMAPFATGLYGASEMVMDGFMHLRRAAILKRLAYDDIGFERAVAEGAIGSTFDGDAIERLYACGALPSAIDEGDLARLKRFGLLPTGARLHDGVVLSDGMEIPADLRTTEARAALARVASGRRLADGRYLRGAFFLGSTDFYDWLRGLEGDDRDGLDMTRVSDVNQLYGGREQLDALQRRDARFFNICMMATLLGAVVSDALEDGRVVSGVGGQYNFVAMAHALPGGRSVLMLRSTRLAHGRVESNIRWNYGHTTIPRHLRDVVVTEYGIADLRGRSDEDCIKAMLAITDARFIDDLASTARKAGKLAGDFRIPDAWRSNTPQRLRDALQPSRDAGVLPPFPLGSDFTDVEQRLLPALSWLRDHSEGWRNRLQLLAAVLRPGPVQAGEGDVLRRMGLATPRGAGERLQRRLLQAALRQPR